MIRNNTEYYFARWDQLPRKTKRILKKLTYGPDGEMWFWIKDSEQYPKYSKLYLVYVVVMGQIRGWIVASLIPNSSNFKRDTPLSESYWGGVESRKSFLMGVFVAPEFRCRGFGGELINHLLGILAPMNKSFVFDEAVWDKARPYILNYNLKGRANNQSVWTGDQTRKPITLVNTASTSVYASSQPSP